MCKQGIVVVAAAVAVLAALAWNQSGVHSAPVAPLTFEARWAPVDEALRSGTFVIKETGRLAEKAS
jgi:hypothetical protein